MRAKLDENLPMETAELLPQWGWEYFVEVEQLSSE